MKKSFSYAFDGLIWAFSHHKNFRIHILVASLVLFMAVVLQVSQTDLLILILAIALGFIAEMVNTSIEEMCNLITLKWSLQAKIAKDVSAAMMLVTSFFTVIIGIIVFIPYIFHVFNS